MKTIKILTTGLFFLLFAQITFAQTTEYTVVKYEVNATCQSCKTTIEGALGKTVGVIHSNLNLDDKIVTVKYNKDETTPEKISEVIKGKGYTTKLVETTPKNGQNQKSQGCNHHCGSKCH
ncbi:MAG: heavy-metal-associated domain-containing protein [Bacteroidales bacterium]|nr:heavy-metal-associated domain-containing protein [Bacteroidales bacterium]